MMIRKTLINSRYRRITFFLAGISLLAGSIPAIAQDVYLCVWRNPERTMKKLFPDAEGYLTAAIEQYRAYETAVASLPDEARSHWELETLLAINGGRAGKPISVAYEKLGRYQEAADGLIDAYRDREPDPGTREHLARLLARTGRHDEALAHARRLAQ